jgi:hypothetical protein
MKNLNIIACLVAALVLSTSCEKDYLDTNPTSETATSTIFETTEGAALAVNGLNKLTTMQYLGSQGFNGEGTIKMYYGNYPGNHFSVNLPGWSSVINSQYHENVTSIYLYYPWYYYYRIIGNANAIILNIDNATGLQSEKDFIKAQALTYRAYCYFNAFAVVLRTLERFQNGASKGLVLRLDASTGDMPLSNFSSGLSAGLCRSGSGNSSIYFFRIGQNR